MKIYIKQTDTGFYFKKPGLFVKERKDALWFEGSEYAAKCCREHRLTGVELVLNATDSGPDLRLPVSPEDSIP